MSAFLALILAALSSPPQDPPPPATRVDDVVVEGQARRPDPFAFFAALCFDGNRLDERATRPSDDPRWRAVTLPSAGDRGLPVDETFVFGEGDLDVALNISEGPDPDRDRVQRNACSLTIVGPHDQAGLETRMSALFGGGGTARHVEYMPEAFPAHPGWSQLAWSAIPSRGMSSWTVYSTGFVVVTDPIFYRRSRWIVAELRRAELDGQPISHISLIHFFRPEPID